MKKIKNIFLIMCLSFFSFSNRIMAATDSNKITTATDCKQVVGGVDVFIVDLFNMVKWVALALAIALGMLDFFKAITGGKDDDLAKAAQKFMKRLIAVVALFILPVLIEWILDISGVPHGGTCLD